MGVCDLLFYFQWCKNQCSLGSNAVECQRERHGGCLYGGDDLIVIVGFSINVFLSLRKPSFSLLFGDWSSCR